jgi:hypothetical protein
LRAAVATALDYAPNESRITWRGKPHGNWEGAIVTTVNQLVEGTCVKHRLLENLLKMYDKFGLLRLENLRPAESRGSASRGQTEPVPGRGLIPVSPR